MGYYLCCTGILAEENNLHFGIEDLLFPLLGGGYQFVVQQ
jgi:hypothetical protein